MSEMREVVAGFRRAVGRDPTDEEIETFTPLFMRAGYDDDDLLWGVVFLLSKQFGAAQMAAQAIQAAGERAAERVEKSTRTARREDRLEIVGYAGIVCLCVLLLAALVTWHFRGGDLHRAWYQAVQVVHAHSPELALKLFSVPDVAPERFAWCGSREADVAYGIAPDELRWCAGPDAGPARELGPDAVAWAASDVGVRAREVVDASTLDFLDSSWGRTTKWAWSVGPKHVVHLEQMIRCDAKSLERTELDSGDYEMCWFKHKFRDEAYWWVPPQ